MIEDPAADLLNRIAQGDRGAFRRLYREASPKLLGVLTRILRDRAEAEDALQEVFTRIWRNAGRFDSARGRAMTWIVAIGRNHAIDLLRARPAATDGDRALEWIADPAPGAEARVQAAGEARRIAECFDTLDPARASAVRGAYLDGLSYAELAEKFDVPLNTMRTWLRRGLLKLRDCLDA